MKVLKDNYSGCAVKEEKKIIKPYPRKCVCDECLSELEYEESDLHMGFLGMVHLTCPLCGAENMIEDNENSIELTKDNVVFPEHFWHFSVESGAVDCCNNEEIRNCIREGIHYFRNNKDDFSWCRSYGNIYVCVNRYADDENYGIVVSNNFYETDIGFETEDY